MKLNTENSILLKIQIKKIKATFFYNQQVNRNLRYPCFCNSKMNKCGIIKSKRSWHQDNDREKLSTKQRIFK